MITKEIQRWKPVVSSVDKPRILPGSNEHREWIFWKQLELVCNTDEWDPGTIVSAKGHGLSEGIVVDVMTDVKDVTWDGLKCCLISVWFQGHQEDAHLFHPSDLKVVKRLTRRIK